MARGDARPESVTTKGELPYEWVTTHSQTREFCKRTALALPSDAQWEYAALGGTQRAAWTRSSIDQVAWHGKNCSDAQPVGTKIPNGFGLHDVFGNVSEACRLETATDLDSSSTLVIRGGDYQSLRTFCGIKCRWVVDKSTVLEPSGIGVRPVFNLYED